MQPCNQERHILTNYFLFFQSLSAFIIFDKILKEEGKYEIKSIYYFTVHRSASTTSCTPAHQPITSPRDIQQSA